MIGFSVRLSGTWIAATLAAVLLASAEPARAEYPDRPLTAIVPFAPGGPSDIIARIVAAGMAKDLGQPIIVQNKAGAGGNIGMGAAASSKPDGYTILLCSVATTQNPATYRNMPYDPLKDLTAVATVGESPTMIAVSTAKIPAKTLAEFVDLVRKNPGKYNVAGAGGQRMTIEKFLMTFGLKMEIISYASGGEAATALMSGESDMQLNNATTLTSGAKSGKIRLLAVGGTQRLKTFPDLPTTAEAGFPEYTDKAYVALYVPTGTPPDIINRLHESANRSMAMAEVAERLRALDYVAEPTSQAEAQQFYISEILRWKDVAAKANIPQIE